MGKATKDALLVHEVNMGKMRDRRKKIAEQPVSKFLVCELSFYPT